MADRRVSLVLKLVVVVFFLFVTSGCLVVVVDAVAATARPRGIIVIQPDDLNFMERWTPPSHFPKEPSVYDVELPNMDRLRINGLQMLRAYTASPWCGTSRYSTMTGRYASRAASSRRFNAGADISLVKIANTQLLDIDTAAITAGGGESYDDDYYGDNGSVAAATTTIADGHDCSHNNMAQVLRSNGYRTGVIGKWHLDNDADLTGKYDYQRIQNRIRSCGFDTAEAIYHENMNLQWTNNQEFTHNMEHLTIRAMDFMDSALDNGEDFFLYFNPTAPHESGNVFEALTKHSCLDTVEGRLTKEPSIPGMTENIGCEAYRKTILNRANGDASNEVLGAIWVDDSVGALLLYLESKGILDSTMIVFQMDHGKEGKGSMYEPGTRIAQFVHYPQEIAPGSTYSGLVSTIDVAPTILDYAGISHEALPLGTYEMDGTSWRGLDDDNNNLKKRCIVIEDRLDRAVVCDCEKYMKIGDRSISGTFRRGNQHGLINWYDTTFQLCDNSTGTYVSSPSQSREATGIVHQPENLVAMLNCHFSMTIPSDTPTYGKCDHLLFSSSPPPIHVSDSDSDMVQFQENASTVVALPASDNDDVTVYPLEISPLNVEGSSSSSSAGRRDYYLSFPPITGLFVVVAIAVFI